MITYNLFFMTLVNVVLAETTSSLLRRYGNKQPTRWNHDPHQDLINLRRHLCSRTRLLLKRSLSISERINEQTRATDLQYGSTTSPESLLFLSTKGHNKTKTKSKSDFPTFVFAVPRLAWQPASARWVNCDEGEGLFITSSGPTSNWKTKGGRKKVKRRESAQMQGNNFFFCFFRRRSMQRGAEKVAVIALKCSQVKRDLFANLPQFRSLKKKKKMVASGHAWPEATMLNPRTFMLESVCHHFFASVGVNSGRACALTC